LIDLVREAPRAAPKSDRKSQRATANFASRFKLIRALRSSSGKISIYEKQK